MQYIIRASDLYQKAKEILNSGMAYVSISLFEPDNTDPDDPLPACVHFSAFAEQMPGAFVDFEDIDVVSLPD